MAVRTLIFAAFWCAWWCATSACVGYAGGLPDAERDAAQREVARALADLDDPRYGVRAEAAARFERLLKREELGGLLAAEVHRALVQPRVSFEVRWHLERWAKRLPEPPVEPPAYSLVDEIADVVAHLEDDDYAARRGGLQRLRWLLENGRLIYPAMTQLKRRLADPRLDEDARRRFEDAYEAARAAWLLSPEGQRDLPALDAKQIDEWIEQLVRRANSNRRADRVACRAAERELLDALARDAEAPRVAAALAARLEGPLDREAHRRLQALAEMTRPAMVAEYWSSRRHQSEQHLLIGVPSLAAGAAYPSHFDRIDDETAHCVSGNTLQPGDHPANVAIPHPLTELAFFHLVNLSTPRRRMAYAYQVNADEAARLKTISRRTLDRFLRDRRGLTEEELMMLAQLDPQEVSRFAGAYFKRVDDSPLSPPSTRERLGGRPSRHGLLCGHLASEGTKEAAPGLIEAIAADRFRPPTSSGPYRMHWLAALAIAVRDPWPEVDRWLASQIDDCQMLVEDGRADAPELGATAAAVLLARHGEDPSHYGLQASADPVLIQVGLDGYRFASSDARSKLQQWWRAKQALQQQP